MSEIADARQAITDSSEASRIYVGCDSIRYKRKGIWHAKYATVIIVHKDGRHGGRMFHDVVEMPDYGSVKQRMLNEVAFGVTHALEIQDVLGKRHFEFHIDINTDPRHKSNVALKEAMGYVRGTLGIDAKPKPYGWAATHCADYLVRH